MKHGRYFPDGTKVHCFQGYRLKNGVVIGHNGRTRKYKIQSDEIFLAGKDSVELGWIDMKDHVWNEAELVPTIFKWSPNEKYIPVSVTANFNIDVRTKHRPVVSHLPSEVNPQDLVVSFS